MAATPAGIDPLFTALYAELRRMAGREVWRQGVRSPLSSRTLVHETYLSMARQPHLSFPDAARFLAYAARVMRGLLIDRARSRDAVRRGGPLRGGGGLRIDVHHVHHEDGAVEQAPGPEATGHDPHDLQALAQALDRLAGLDAALVMVVELRYLCGLDLDEVAALLQVSPRTVQRRWEKARILLHALLEP